MPTGFEAVILKMKELGFFKFLFPFMLTAAILYGALRKSHLFGDPDKNIAVNAVIAVIGSLFVWAMPIILGINIETQLAAFFVQGMAVSLVVIIGLLIIGMFFPPDLAKSLAERFKGGWFWGAIIIGALMLGVILLISSGLYKVLFPGGASGFGLNLSGDTLITFVFLIIMVGVILAIVRAGGK